jgi:hypothetical protein
MKEMTNQDRFNQCGLLTKSFSTVHHRDLYDVTLKASIPHIERKATQQEAKKATILIKNIIYSIYYRHALPNQTFLSFLVTHCQFSRHDAGLFRQFFPLINLNPIPFFIKD